MHVLNRYEVPAPFQELYIINGYRRADTSLWQCIKYMFVLHNDFGNFWTHFIPLWIWLYWLYRLSFQLDLTDPYWYPLLAIWIGGCAYTLCSSMAHAFGSKSIVTRQICFMTDYQGISLYSVGAGIAYYFYERPIDSWLFGHKWCIIAVCTTLAINASLISSLSRFLCTKKHQCAVRAIAYTFPCVCVCGPFCARLCISYTANETIDTLPLHCCICLTLLFALFFFVSRLPESLIVATGKFDYFFHSHQLFHVFAAMMTSLQFYTLPIDAMTRREELTKDPYYQPDLWSALMPLFIMCACGAFTVFVLSLLFTKSVGQFIEAKKLY